MAFPLIVPLLAAGAGLAFFLTRKDDHPSGGGASVPTLPGTLGMGDAFLDAGLPDNVRQAVLVALRDERDPGKLHSFAAALRGEGFPIAANQLETKANALGFSPSVPQNVPQAPLSIPPAPNQPAVFIPPQAPVFIPTVDPNAIPIPMIPGMPSAPTFDLFDPGVPSVPSIPSAGGAQTDAHAALQRALVNFYAGHAVKYPTGNSVDKDRTLLSPLGTILYGVDQIDGIWGPDSQLALWGFQSWANVNRGLALTRDGLPGTNSQAALREFGA